MSLIVQEDGKSDKHKSMDQKQEDAEEKIHFLQSLKISGKSNFELQKNIEKEKKKASSRSV